MKNFLIWIPVIQSLQGQLHIPGKSRSFSQKKLSISMALRGAQEMPSAFTHLIQTNLGLSIFKYSPIFTLVQCTLGDVRQNS